MLTGVGGGDGDRVVKLQKIVSREFGQVKSSAIPVFNRPCIGATSSKKLGIQCLPCPMRPRNPPDW